MFALISAALIPGIAAATETRVVIQSHPELGGKCLDVPFEHFVPGMRVQMWSCNGNPSQIFSYDDQTRQLRIGGLCVQSWGRGDPTDPVGLDLCGQAAQVWQLSPDREYNRLLGINGMCLDLHYGNSANGAPLQVYTCKNGERAQLWSVRGTASAQTASVGVRQGEVRAGGTNPPIPGSATAGQAQGGSVKAIFEKYNLLGTFAWDCTRVPGKDNLYFVHRLIDADHAQRDEMSAPTTRDHVMVIDKVSVEGEHVLRLAGSRDGAPMPAVPWAVQQDGVQEFGPPGARVATNKFYKCPSDARTFPLTFDENTDRVGLTIREFNLPAADARLCQKSCIEEGQCTAWVYRKPEGRTDGKPHCWLRNAISAVNRGFSDNLTITGAVRPEAAQ